MRNSTINLSKRNARLSTKLWRVVPCVLSLYAYSTVISRVVAPPVASQQAVSETPAQPGALESKDALHDHDQESAAHISLVSEIIAGENPSHPHKASLAQIIVAESKKVELDPLLVSAVVSAESMFRHKAISPRGAQGLMQIMPATGRFIAKQSSIKLESSLALHNPETNIKLGVWYLRYLMQKFKGDLKRTLVAYNWGPTNVIKSGATGDSIPKESLEYAHKVLSHHSLWKAKRSQVAALRAQSSLG
jgi:soluble lytic murein transglycosylase-like protein